MRCSIGRRNVCFPSRRTSASTRRSHFLSRSRGGRDDFPFDVRRYHDGSGISPAQQRDIDKCYPKPKAAIPKNLDVIGANNTIKV